MTTSKPLNKPSKNGLNSKQLAESRVVRLEIDARLKNKRLTPGLRRIIQCAIDHAGEIGVLTSMELAALANTSQPTVSRLASTLGYDGFLDMRRSLHEAVSKPLPKSGSHQNRYQSAAVAESANVADLAATLSDISMIRNLGTMLAKSKPLIVLGLRASAGVASTFHFFASKVHPDVRLINQGGSMVEDCLEQGASAGATFVLAFALPLYPNETINALKFAKQLGLKIGIVSDPAFESHFNGLGDFLLPARINSSLVFDSSASTAVLTSVILDAMCDAMSEHAEARLEAIDKSSARRKVFPVTSQK